MNTHPTESVLLSIAIPTKNRQIYLMNLVDELLTSDSQEFEIVIQDNSSDKQLETYVAKLNDRRVHYNYYGDWISVVDNCDSAIRSSSGHYVCMLGDDDGIMLDEALEVLHQAKVDNVDALMTQILLYTWPDLHHRMFTDFGGKLYLSPLKSGIKKGTVQGQAKAVISRSGAMGLEGLPCVYHGFIRKDVLSALEAKTGSNFPGPSPDMANAVGINHLINTYRWEERPLVISGHSKTSGAGRGTVKEHRGAIAEQSHLPADTVENWYTQIPFYWSGPTIYAQSLRSALDRTGAEALGRPKDACLYAACFVFERSFWRETLRTVNNSEHSPWCIWPKIAYYLIYITRQRAIQFTKNLRARLFSQKETMAASTIAEAIKRLRSSEKNILSDVFKT